MDANAGSESHDPGLSVWNAVLGVALRLPGARVDRASFLRSALGPHAAASVIEQAVTLTPAKAGVSRDAIRRTAEGSVKWHRVGVSTTSTVLGLPGGWWLAAAIPTDLGQYFWHLIVLLQKLAYLHGWPELLQDGEEIDDETKLVLTLFVGVILGAEGAADGLGKLAQAVAAQVVKKLPQAPLSKYALYQVAKQVAKWIGVSLTKKKFAEAVGRVIPVLGGVFAGTVTWILFGTGAKRLRIHLEGLPLAAP